MITMLKCNCRCCSHVVDVEHKSLDDKTEAEAVRYLRENFKGKKTVLPALEFAARLNREIGLGTNGDGDEGLGTNGAGKKLHVAERCAYPTFVSMTAHCQLSTRN